MENQIKLKRTAKKHLKTYTEYEKIKNNLQKTVPKLELLKDDKELLNSVCNKFEDAIDTKKYNVNKKELVLNLYSELFDTSEEYLKKVADDIEYLWNHGAIKKTSVYKKVLKGTYNLLKNFVLILIK
jgi:glutaredoxin 2